MIDLDQIRSLATRQARAKIAQDVGEIVMGDTIAAVERDWARRYLTHWFRAFSYFSALQLSGNDHSAAREILASEDVQDEIRTRVEMLTPEHLQDGK